MTEKKKAILIHSVFIALLVYGEFLAHQPNFSKWSPIWIYTPLFRIRLSTCIVGFLTLSSLMITLWEIEHGLKNKFLISFRRISHLVVMLYFFLFLDFF